MKKATTPEVQSSSDNLVSAVDLGGTNLRAANIDSDGRIHDRLSSATPESDNPDDIVEAIATAVSKCRDAAEKRSAIIHAVSVVVPGSVHSETSAIVNAPNLPAIVNFGLAEALARKIGNPVLLENDANAAALGEMWQGAARGSRTIVCLTLGTGVGSGIILDGRLWHGVDGTAGEIGHTSVEPFDGVLCKCGNTGCLEVCASATAIVRMAREGLAQHRESSLSSIATNELTAKAVAAHATCGDGFARKLFQRVGVYLGIAAANIVNTLNPEMIVIGGGVSAAFELFAPHVQQEINKRAFPVPAQRCRLAKAECGDDAGLLGAAALVFAEQ